MKRCGKCGQTKPETGFYRDSRAKDGLRGWCRACDRRYNTEYHRRIYHDPTHPHHEKRRANARAGSEMSSRREKDPTDPYYWAKRERMWADQGILTPTGAPFTRAEFWEMWFAQGGHCAMCGHLFDHLFEHAVRKANVDHWHRKGKFGPARALLCWICNRRVGDLTYESGKVLWAYLSQFDPSRAPAHAPAHPPPHAPTREGA